ncbi:MAG: hypothetical protein IT427_12275 [Pirellulales bacterium]|nr:hypothetical protein [Pirellulales bacterium]
MPTFPPRLVAVGLMIAACACTGCVSSLKPLSDEKASTPDERLLGTWEFEDKETMEKHTIVVERKQDAAKVLRASAIEKGKQESADLLITKIGNDHFVSVGNKDGQGVMKYTIAKYELADGNTLNFWGFETEFFAKAVENNELKGTVKQDLFKEVTLDDTPENLRKFIEKNGAQCFTKETAMTIKRLKGGK